jgi:hypothetical protein
LAARLPEQAALRWQQQQQQRLPKGQVLPDQEAELDNSLNTLGLVLMRLWQLGCAAAEQPATGDAINVGIVLNLMRCSEMHALVAQHAEVMLWCWPNTDISGSNADASAASSSSSSSSSTGHSHRSEPVRYGKLVLPRLPLVTYTAALPVALAAAQMLACYTDAVQQLLTANITSEQHELDDEHDASCAQEVGLAVQYAIDGMGDRSVLALQLLLLACQAKVHWHEVAGKQQQRATVCNLRPSSCQQQQQQQLIAAGEPEYLRLRKHHDLLLETYHCKDADIAAILGQQQEGLPRTT